MSCLYLSFFMILYLFWISETIVKLRGTHEWLMFFTDPIWWLLTSIIILHLVYGVWLNIQAAKAETERRKNYGLGMLRRACHKTILTWDQKLFAIHDGQHIVPSVLLEFQPEYHCPSRELLEEEWETICSQQVPFALELWEIQLSDHDMTDLREFICFGRLPCIIAI